MAAFWQNWAIRFEIFLANTDLSFACLFLGALVKAFAYKKKFLIKKNNNKMGIQFKYELNTEMQNIWV